MKNDHPVTRAELDVMFNNMIHTMQLSEVNLSERLSNRINDTYWKLIPIIIGIIAVSNGILFAAFTVVR